MAELADAQDLKSCGTNLPYRFDSGRRHYSESVGNIVVISVSRILFFVNYLVRFGADTAKAVSISSNMSESLFTFRR